MLKNGLVDNAVTYQAQSGDPNETPDTMVERDLAAGKIDVAAVWGPVAGFVVSRHDSWVSVPFITRYPSLSGCTQACSTCTKGSNTSVTLTCRNRSHEWAP